MFLPGVKSVPQLRDTLSLLAEGLGLNHQKPIVQVPNGFHGLPFWFRFTVTSMVVFGPEPAVVASVKPLRK